MLTLINEIEDCHACNLRDNCTNVTTPHGVTKPRFMFVIDPPSREDMQANRPLSGRANKMLSQMLTEAGFTPNECYLTNIIKCFNKKYNDEANSIRFCANRWILREIQEFRPEKIIVFGTRHIFYFTGEGKYPKKQLQYIGQSKVFMGIETHFLYSPRVLLRKGMNVVNWQIQKLKEIHG